MSSISSIDTSIYSGLLESTQATTGRNAPEAATTRTYDSSDVSNSRVDLSNYYSNIRPEDLLSNVGDNVVQSAQNQSLFGHQFHFHLLLFINYMQL